jgi:hypothetical protein
VPLGKFGWGFDLEVRLHGVDPELVAERLARAVQILIGRLSYVGVRVIVRRLFGTVISLGHSAVSC